MKAIDIERVLRELGCDDIAVTAVGKVKSSCPFAPWRHGGGVDSHPSFVVWTDDKSASSYYCAGCKSRGGSMLSLVWAIQELSKRDLTSLVRFVGKTDGGMDPVERLREYEYRPVAGGVRKPKKNKMKPISEGSFAEFEKVSPYFLQRGLTAETCRAWRLGDDPRRKRALFSMRDVDGRLYAVSGRLYEEKCCGVPYKQFKKKCPVCGRKKQPKYLHSRGFNKKELLYGEHMIDRKCSVGIVVEGNLDPIAVWQAGYRNPVATMGSEPSDLQCEKLVEFFDRLVVFCDGDDAGRRMAEFVGRKLGKRMPVLMKAAPDGEDPASLSKEQLRKILGEPFYT